MPNIFVTHILEVSDAPKDDVPRAREAGLDRLGHKLQFKDEQNSEYPRPSVYNCTGSKKHEALPFCKSLQRALKSVCICVDHLWSIDLLRNLDGMEAARKGMKKHGEACLCFPALAQCGHDGSGSSGPGSRRPTFAPVTGDAAGRNHPAVSSPWTGAQLSDLFFFRICVC